MVTKRVVLSKDVWSDVQPEYNAVLLSQYSLVRSADQCIQLSNWLEYYQRAYQYLDSTRSLDLQERRSGFISLVSEMIEEGLLPKGVKYKFERQNFGNLSSRLLNTMRPSLLVEEGGGFTINFMKLHNESRHQLCWRLSVNGGCSHHSTEFWNRARLCSPAVGWTIEMKQAPSQENSGLDEFESTALSKFLISEYVAVDYLRIELPSNSHKTVKYLINSLRCADMAERQCALEKLSFSIQYRMSFVRDSAKNYIDNTYRIARAFDTPSSYQKFLLETSWQSDVVDKAFDKILKTVSTQIIERNRAKVIDVAYETDKIVNLNEVVVKLVDKEGIVERSLKKCSSPHDSLSRYLGRYNCSHDAPKTAILSAAVDIVHKIDALTKRIDYERRRVGYCCYMDSPILKNLVRRRKDLKNHERALIILFPQYENWLIELFNVKNRKHYHYVYEVNEVRDVWREEVAWCAKLYRHDCEQVA